MRYAPATLALLLGAALGCGDPLGPEDVADTFVLRRIGGDPLPAVSFAWADQTTRILADTLRLAADGQAAKVSVREIEHLSLSEGEGRLETVRWESQLRFRVVDGRIEAEYVCGPGALCVRPPHLVARRVGDELRVEYALGDRVPQLYVRVGPP